MIQSSFARIFLALSAIGLGSLPLAFQEDEYPPAPKPEISIPVQHKGELKETDCAQCHSAVTAEWSQSAHGLAWLDGDYQRALKKKRRAKKCYSCHIPQPLLSTGELPKRIQARDTDKHLGVTCNTCHLGPDALVLGPRGEESKAHLSAASAFMTSPGSNALCISCHDQSVGPVIGIADDFVELGMPDRGLSCVGCHMAPAKRRWADGDGIPEREGRSHALQTPRDPAFAASAFGVAWMPDAAGGRVRILNQAGHQVPGLEGRSFVFQATLLKADGTEVDSATLTIDAQAYLPANGQLDIKLKGVGTSVKLTGVHHSPRQKEPLTFLTRSLGKP